MLHSACLLNGWVMDEMDEERLRQGFDVVGCLSHIHANSILPTNMKSGYLSDYHALADMSVCTSAAQPTLFSLQYHATFLSSAAWAIHILKIVTAV